MRGGARVAHHRVPGGGRRWRRRTFAAAQKAVNGTAAAASQTMRSGLEKASPVEADALAPVVVEVQEVSRPR